MGKMQATRAFWYEVWSALVPAVSAEAGNEFA